MIIIIRLGLELYSHLCRCGNAACSDVSVERTLHRHYAINYKIWRPLQYAGAPNTKEPIGLLGADGKWLDGPTLIPWSAGKRMPPGVLQWSTLQSIIVFALCRQVVYYLLQRLSFPYWVRKEYQLKVYYLPPCERRCYEMTAFYRLEW